MNPGHPTKSDDPPFPCFKGTTSCTVLRINSKQPLKHVPCFGDTENPSLQLSSLSSWLRSTPSRCLQVDRVSGALERYQEESPSRFLPILEGAGIFGALGRSFLRRCTQIPGMIPYVDCFPPSPKQDAQFAQELQVHNSWTLKLPLKKGHSPTRIWGCNV